MDAPVGASTFGPIDRVRPRFERHCPDAEKAAAEPYWWRCSAVVGAGLSKVVSLTLEPSGGPDRLDVRTVRVNCLWERGLGPDKACDPVVDAVAYVRDATGMDERNADRLVETIRRNPEAKVWAHVRVADLSVYYHHVVLDGGKEVAVVLEANPDAWGESQRESRDVELTPTEP